MVAKNKHRVKRRRRDNPELSVGQPLTRSGSGSDTFSIRPHQEHIHHIPHCATHRPHQPSASKTCCPTQYTAAETTFTNKWKQLSYRMSLTYKGKRNINFNLLGHFNYIKLIITTQVARNNYLFLVDIQQYSN